MKIAQSDVSLAASYEKIKDIKEEEKLVQWNRPQDAPNNRTAGTQFSQASKDASGVEEMPLDAKLMSIIRALEALTGKKIDISTYKKILQKRAQKE